MTIRKINIVLVLIMGILITGCSSSDLCMQEMKVRLKVDFKQMKYDTSSEQYKEQTKEVSVIVHGKGIDSLLYDSATLNTMELPLQINDSISVFVIKQAYTPEGDTVPTYVTDTLWVKHENSIEFVSVECGAVVVNDIKAVLWTINRIDSVSISDRSVNRTGNSNLKIYVKK